MYHAVVYKEPFKLQPIRHFLALKSFACGLTTLLNPLHLKFHNCHKIMTHDYMYRALVKVGLYSCPQISVAQYSKNRKVPCSLLAALHKGALSTEQKREEGHPDVNPEALNPKP